MYPVENPEKQAPNPRPPSEPTSTPGKDHGGSERPADDQVFRDWASI